MGFFTTAKKDNQDAFIDAVVKYESSNGGYYGSSAIKNSDVFTAIRVLASDIASSPLQLFDGDKLAKSDKFYYLLNTRPNDYVDGFHFKFSLMANMLLNGNSYAEIDDPNNPTELTLISNSSMTVKQDATSQHLFYEVSDGSKVRTLPASKVLHFKYFSQDGLTGVSPLMSLKDELTVQGAGNKMLTNFYKNGINSNGILSVQKSDLDADAKANIRQQFEKANAGTGNSSKTIVLDSSMTYTPIEVSADILNLVNSNDWSSKQIAKAFGLSMYQLGIEESHSNITQTALNYINTTLSHYFNSFTAELGFKLLAGSKQAYNFRFNADRLLNVDPVTNLKNSIQGVQGSIYTINEARQKVNLEPVEGGDKLLASLNYTSLDNLQNYQNSKNTEGSNE
ncbi:phage portal protein [Holzapfeliella sp. JNUCC 72]